MCLVEKGGEAERRTAEFPRCAGERWDAGTEQLWRMKDYPVMIGCPATMHR